MKIKSIEKEKQKVIDQLKEFDDVSDLTIIQTDHIMLELICDVYGCGYAWYEPYFYSSDGYICVEWYNPETERAVYFDFKNNETEYTKLSGIPSEIKEQKGRLTSDSCLPIWQWFIGDENVKREIS